MISSRRIIVFEPWDIWLSKSLLNSTGIWSSLNGGKQQGRLHSVLELLSSSIPVAVASDLIHCSVRLTTQSDKNYKDREQLEQLSKLDKPAVFAVQLSHRWFVCLHLHPGLFDRFSLCNRAVRTFVHSSFPTKPVKIFQVNVYVSPWSSPVAHFSFDQSRAGYVNPLQHMREPNENVIQMVRAKVRESVQALEALLDWKSDVHIPVDACFSQIDSERGIVACDWSRTEVYPPAEYRARVRSLPSSRIDHRQFVGLDRLWSWNNLFLRTKLCQRLYYVSTRPWRTTRIKTNELFLGTGWISRSSSDNQSIDRTEPSSQIKRSLSSGLTCCAHFDRST